MKELFWVVLCSLLCLHAVIEVQAVPKVIDSKTQVCTINIRGRHTGPEMTVSSIGDNATRTRANFKKQKDLMLGISIALPTELLGKLCQIVNKQIV